MDELELRKLLPSELNTLYLDNLKKLYDKNFKNLDEYEETKNLVGILYADFLRRGMSIPRMGTINQAPSLTVKAPSSDDMPAANVRSLEDGVGGLVEGDNIRVNYVLRRNAMIKQREQQEGQSSGGANYVEVLYEKKENSKIFNPNPCGGYRNYFYAYGDQQKTYCVKNLDEY